MMNKILIAIMFVFLSFPLAGCQTTKRVEPLNFIDEITETTDNLDSEGWAWDAETLTLTINGLHLSYVDDGINNGAAILLPDASTVEISGRNSIVADDSEQLCVGILTNNLTIQGQGILEIESAGDGFSVDDITINGGTVIINAIHGIYAGNDFILNNGVIEINDSRLGICAINNVIINGGYIEMNSVERGILAVNDLNINDGAINIRATKNGINVLNDMIIDNNSGEIEEIYSGELKISLIINDNPVSILVGGTLFSTPGIIFYTVTFDLNDGTIINGHSTESEQMVEEGVRILNPPTVIKSGYEFQGWFSDAELTTPFNLNTPITTDITLYEYWQSEQ
ncbi:MAG: InlB B-repeat-containing protein [Clostridiales bacterium]|jgi:hypothetical protein|nr:InlB B-repeat-containing protein [Clostridiales bacterium]